MKNKSDQHVQWMLRNGLIIKEQSQLFVISRYDYGWRRVCEEKKQKYNTFQRVQNLPNPQSTAGLVLHNGSI